MRALFAHEGPLQPLAVLLLAFYEFQLEFWCSKKFPSPSLNLRLKVRCVPRLKWDSAEIHLNRMCNNQTHQLWNYHFENIFVVSFKDPPVHRYRWRMCIELSYFLLLWSLMALCSRLTLQGHEVESLISAYLYGGYIHVSTRLTLSLNELFCGLSLSVVN